MRDILLRCTESSCLFFFVGAETPCFSRRQSPKMWGAGCGADECLLSLRMYICIFVHCVLREGRNVCFCSTDSVGKFAIKDPLFSLCMEPLFKLALLFVGPPAVLLLATCVLRDLVWYSSR